MNSAGQPELKELLIASVTPPNLERGALWFSENLASIKKARISNPAPFVGNKAGGEAQPTKGAESNPWWRDNTLIIEKDLVLKPSEFTRRLIDLGYERTQSVLGKGLFAARGGIVEVWPINTEGPYIIEFFGNSIASITGVMSKFPPLDGEGDLPARQAGGGVPPTLPPPRRGEELRLRPGSYVVHVDHGIGIFRGITEKQEVRVKNQADSLILDSKFLILEYAPARKGGPPDILYVSVEHKDRVTPYVGFTTPTIHRLGGTVWFKTKRKAREDAEKLAKELLELYAKRHQTKRQPYLPDEMLEREIETSFAFEETEGQLRAEEEIKKDLSRETPMDRILCGDVGFGKTEVAIRAALRVMASGKQVAVLAPTTVLAAQHDRTFKERFDSSLLVGEERWGVPSPSPSPRGGGKTSGVLAAISLASLSRLTTPSEEKRILKELTEGKIDCVIGTHRLLSKDVLFKNLGLVIIDEEQRFGVKQKERFKEMRSEVDILSLSATPIPRTLSLALAKLRDISVIETPPPERLPIQTLVLPYSKKTIRHAIQYELARGGQVYFLHNRIETIEGVKEKVLKSIVSGRDAGFLAPRALTLGAPTAKNLAIGVIHGRMKEKEIIRVMDQFRNGEIKILLATTIIENGLDISSANTLIVNDATRLGLAEAHQLRGRIGRGNKQAFAYFLYKPRHLTEKSFERLEALKEYSDLGSGYQIALRDLEIRGAGNVLGKEQSGTINKVGLNLYCQMLAEAVESQR